MKGVSNVDIVLIPDAKVFACMSQVNKVVLEADAVFANGGYALRFFLSGILYTLYFSGFEPLPAVTRYAYRRSILAFL